MFSIFKPKPKTNGTHHEPDAAERELDEVVDTAKRVADDLVEDLRRRARQKRMLKGALDGD